MAVRMLVSLMILPGMLLGFACVHGRRQRIVGELLVAVGMDRIEPFERHVHRTIHRCAGARQHADDPERMVFVQA